MNKYFKYENFDLWEREKWTNKDSKIFPLIKWIGENHPVTECDSYIPPVCDDPRKLPYFQPKAGCVDDPKVVNYWAEKGITYNSFEMGCSRWISMVPIKADNDAKKDYKNKVPTLLVFTIVNYSDPYWAAKVVEHYHDYNEAAAKENFIIIYICTEAPDNDRMYGNQLQEAIVLYPIDVNKIYIDVSLIYKKGLKISDVPGYVYTDLEGNVQNPDDYIEKLCGIDVLNISRRWEDRNSLGRGLVMDWEMNKTGVDSQWTIHSETGRKLMEGIVLEYKYDTLYDEGLLKHWNDMGLYFGSHELYGQRWTVLVPKQAMEEPERKLPVMVVFQEVNYSNEHLAVTGKSYCYEYNKIAAQGECIALYFALEDPDSNDMLVDILREAEKIYPIDSRRIYITGHSHDGFFSFEFARRHPDIIAAVATMGNGVGLSTEETTGNAVMFPSMAKLDVMRNYDIPIINICGCGESGAMLPVRDDKVRYKRSSRNWSRGDTFIARAEAWQRRLYACNCPNKTIEEIAEASDSEDKATRIMGIPNDRNEVLWGDGFEHYIADIKNNNGKYHLRMVASENMPHIPTPFQMSLAWSFCRRFARDRKTGECIELY